MPEEIELCLKPAVFENTNTLIGCCALIVNATSRIHRVSEILFMSISLGYIVLQEYELIKIKKDLFGYYRG